MLVEVYGDTVLTDKCREWFRCFKDGDFSVEASLWTKKFEDKELEALLEENQSQTQEKLAESLGVTQPFQAVSVQLRAMRIDSKTRKLGELFN